MSGNIVIDKCISEPWVIEGTDISKPNEIVLFNLAVGQLAEIGTRYGAQLNTESNVVAEIAEAVNTIQDRSAEVASKFDTWTQSVDLGITSAPVLSSILNSLYNPNSTNDTVSKLIKATGMLSTTDAFFDSSKFVTASLLPSDGGSAVSFVSSSNFPNQSVTSSNATPPVITPVTVPDLVIYRKYISPGNYDPALSVNYEGTTYKVRTENIKPLWIPSSDAEVKNLQLALQSQNAAASSLLLLDKTQILPTPSELVDPATLPSDAKVTMEIAVGDMSGVRFKVSDQPTKYVYPSDSLDKLKVITATRDLVAADKNTLVKLSSGEYAWVYENSPSGLAYKTVLLERFVTNPTALQKANWLSQYTDKVVRVTQRSAEQTNFVKMLSDRYQYFFDASTNVLQILSSLTRQLARNL
jgi:hypothetical protein